MSASSPESDPLVLIRCGSHRARQRLQSMVPYKLKGYYSWDTACTGGFVMVPTSLLGAALCVTGCTKASPRFTYNECYY